MKVFILCMTFAAVTLAMPVAEEKPEVLAVAESAPVPKIDEIQPQVKADSAVLEEKKPEQTVEKKEPEKSLESEPKSAPVESKPEEVVQPEAPVAVNPPAEVKSEVPEPKTPKPVIVEPELKPVDSQTIETKTEDKKVPEQKSTVEESKEVIVAKVEEVKAEPSLPSQLSPKSALPEEDIDVISAIKTPAAVADDVIDAAAISPPEKTELPVVVATKSAEPITEYKKEETLLPEPKKTLPEEIKPIESKTEEKPATIVVAVPASVSKEEPAAPKAAVVNAAPIDDPLRVVRDTVDEKQTTEADIAVVKAVAPAKEVEASKESEADKKQDSKDLKTIEPVIPSKLAKETPVASLPEPVETPNTGEADAKNTKDDEKLTSAADSSEESSESIEKTKKDSSEEVADNKKSDATKS